MATLPDSRVAAAPDQSPPSRGVRGQCRNCGADVDGAWCSKCGQETQLALPSVGTFLRESAGRYVALDGRFWRTLYALLVRPGFLTREYFVGRRRRYVRPSRLILVLSLTLFALLRIIVDAPMLVSDAREDPASAARPEQADQETKASNSVNAQGQLTIDADIAKSEFIVSIDPDDDLFVGVGDNPVLALIRPRVDQFNRLPRKEKIEQIYFGVMRYGPYALIGLLPAFALLLKLVYPGRRRYPDRPRRYAEHLVFAAHNHAFLCLVLILATLPVPLLRWALLGWTAVYLAWSMRAVYGGRWAGVALRAFLIATIYAVLFSLAFAGLLLMAALLR